MKKYSITILFMLFATVVSVGFNSSSEYHFHPKKDHLPLNHKKEAKTTVNIALLLDTSNSMDGLINQAKSQLWDIVNEFTYAKCGREEKPDLKIALYQYGNDNLSKKESYIQQVTDFTSDLDEISEKLFSLATNGGEEYCGAVIKSSLQRLDWGRGNNNLNIIFIAGNEPFDQGSVDFRDAAADAKEKGVVINTIFCGDYNQGIHTLWQKGALLSGGEYMAIDHNRKAVYITTPYDAIILTLNSRLNNTYVSYGALGKPKMANQQAQDANAMELEEAVAVKRAISKSSSFYTNKSWDLVDAAMDSDFDYRQLAVEDLPEELQGMSTTEIKKYVSDKKMERVAIQKEIRELQTKRQAYIAENQKSESQGALETAMLKAIKAQALKKNLRWE